MSGYLRERPDPFHPGYGRVPRIDPRNVRRRYSTAAEPDRSLPQIPTLPVGFNLPPLSTNSRYAAPPISMPVPALQPEPSLESATRTHLTSMTMPAHRGSPVWPQASAIDNTISYIGRREQNNHDDGDRSGLEHHQRPQNASRFSAMDVPYFESPAGVSFDTQYNRRTSIPPTYDHALTRYNHHSGSFISDSDRSKTSAASGLLPPIEPAPYRNETQLGPTLPAPLQPGTVSDLRAVNPHQLQSHANGSIGQPEQKSPPWRPGPQT